MKEAKIGIILVYIYASSITAQTPPSVPPNVTIVSSGREFLVQWKAPLQTYGEITTYLVNYNILPNLKVYNNIVKGNHTFAFIPFGDNFGQLFLISIQASNDYGIGKQSAPRYIRADCGDSIYIAPSAEETIVSPSYPNKFHPGVMCVWKLSTNVTHGFKIHIADIGLKTGILDGQCGRTFVLIKTDLEKDSQKICSNLSDFRMDSSTIKLIFQSGIGNDTTRGFKFVIESVVKKPLPPSSITLSQLQNAILVTWLPPTGSHIAISSYRLCYQTLPNLSKICVVILANQNNRFIINTQNHQGQVYVVTMATVVEDMESHFSTNKIIRASCSRTYFISTGQVVQITSPSYPSPYPPSVICHWSIQTLDNSPLVVHRRWIDIQNSTACNADFIKFVSTRIERLCGSSKTTTAMVFTSGSAAVTFVSDERVEGRGFLLEATTDTTEKYYRRTTSKAAKVENVATTVVPLISKTEQITTPSVYPTLKENSSPFIISKRTTISPSSTAFHEHKQSQSVTPTSIHSSISLLKLSSVQSTKRAILSTPIIKRTTKSLPFHEQTTLSLPFNKRTTFSIPLNKRTTLPTKMPKTKFSTSSSLFMKKTTFTTQATPRFYTELQKLTTTMPRYSTPHSQNTKTKTSTKSQTLKPFQSTHYHVPSTRQALSHHSNSPDAIQTKFSTFDKFSPMISTKEPTKQTEKATTKYQSTTDQVRSHNFTGFFPDNTTSYPVYIMLLFHFNRTSGFEFNTTSLRTELTSSLVSFFNESEKIEIVKLRVLNGIVPVQIAVHFNIPKLLKIFKSNANFSLIDIINSTSIKELLNTEYTWPMNLSLDKTALRNFIKGSTFKNQDINSPCSLIKSVCLNCRESPEAKYGVLCSSLQLESSTRYPSTKATRSGTTSTHSYLIIGVSLGLAVIVCIVVVVLFCHRHSLGREIVVEGNNNNIPVHDFIKGKDSGNVVMTGFSITKPIKKGKKRGWSLPCRTITQKQKDEADLEEKVKKLGKFIEDKDTLKDRLRIKKRRRRGDSL